MLVLVSSLVGAKELITVQIGSSPTQSNTAVYLRTLETANKMQTKYEFIPEFKPGANGVLALKAMDASPSNRLATVAAAFVENAKQGHINEADYIPVSTQGDACWAVITNVGDTKLGTDSLRGIDELVVGGTGFGNVAHIVAIALSEKYKFKLRYIVYKSNFDGLVAMVGNNGPNMVLERVASYQMFKDKNPKLQVLGIDCSKRNSAMPNVKTLAEQGFNVPSVFISTVANKAMPEQRRKEISKILESAQMSIGEKAILDSSDMNPPAFFNPPMSVEEFFNKRVSQMHYLTTKYKDKIDEARNK